MRKKLVVSGVHCCKCHDLVFSRARHDLRSCSCGNISVDGGFEYLKLSYKEERYEIKTFAINQTKEELYHDWNSGEDKYGVIEGDLSLEEIIFGSKKEGT